MSWRGPTLLEWVYISWHARADLVICRCQPSYFYFVPLSQPLWQRCQSMSRIFEILTVANLVCTVAVAYISVFGRWLFARSRPFFVGVCLLYLLILNGSYLAVASNHREYVFSSCRSPILICNPWIARILIFSLAEFWSAGYSEVALFCTQAQLVCLKAHWEIYI